MQVDRLTQALAPCEVEPLVPVLMKSVFADAGSGLWTNLEVIPRILGKKDAEVVAALRRNVHGLIQFAALAAMSSLLTRNLNQHAQATGELVSNTRRALGLSMPSDDTRAFRPIGSAPDPFCLDIPDRVTANLVDEMLSGLDVCDGVEARVRAAVIASPVCASDDLFARSYSRDLAQLGAVMEQNEALQSSLRDGAPKTFAAINNLGRIGLGRVWSPVGPECL